MEIILLDKVANVGALGDKVTVKSGYARNFLIPQGKAVFASSENIAVFEQRRAELEQEATESVSAAEARKAQLDALQEGVTIKQKVGDEGKLFGSVGAADIVTACVAAGVEITKSEVRLPEGAFRLVGDYEVVIHLHTDVETRLMIKVIGEE